MILAAIARRSPLGTSLRSMKRRQFLQTTGASLSGLALSSCGWTLADVRPTSEKGAADQLFVYTWAGYTDQALLDRFEKQTGIRVTADVYDSNESMLARIQASGGGGYSIIYPSDYMVQQMKDLNLLQPLNREKLFGLENLLQEFQNPGYDPNNAYSLPISWGTTGILYNRRFVKTPPQDWDDFWTQANAWKKRFTLLNDVREVMGATLKSLGYSYNATDPQQVEKAYQKLLTLKPAIASFTSDAWRSQILSGDLYAAMCYSSDANEIMLESEDLAYVLPQSGSSLWVDTLAIPRSAPNLDGAYAWLNFLLQPDVAADITQTLNFATPNREATLLLPEAIRNNPSYFPPESDLEKCEGLRPLPEAMNDLYDRYWTRLTSS